MVRREVRIGMGAALVMACVGLAGCENRQAAKDCMANAVNNTILTAQSDSELDAALGQQDLSNCPQDFVAPFVTLGNAVHLYSSVRQELAAHEGQQDAVMRDSVFVTLRDAFNGTNSGQTPLADWQGEGDELKQRVATTHRDMEQAIASVKEALAQHGLFITNAPDDGATNTANNEAI